MAEPARRGHMSNPAEVRVRVCRQPRLQTNPAVATGHVAELWHAHTRPPAQIPRPVCPSQVLCGAGGGWRDAVDSGEAVPGTGNGGGNLHRPTSPVLRRTTWQRSACVGVGVWGKGRGNVLCVVGAVCR